VCRVFFPKIELPGGLACSPRGMDRFRRRVREHGDRGRWRERGGKAKILKMASQTHRPRSNSGANFEGPFFPRRGTSTAAENYPARTTQSCRGRPISWPWANRVQTVPPGGVNCASPLSYLRERSTSLLRDFYPDALARRTVPRHVLN
jgi:hypothetical protein